MILLEEAISAAVQPISTRSFHHLNLGEPLEECFEIFVSSCFQLCRDCARTFAWKREMWLAITFRLAKYEAIWLSLTSLEIPDKKNGLKFFRFRFTPTNPSGGILD